MALVWGVAPLHDPQSLDAPADTARRVAMEQGLAESGHRVLTVAGLGGDGSFEPVPTLSVLTV
jgi:pyruvate kinase